MSLDTQSPNYVPGATDENPPTNSRRTRRKPAEAQGSRDTSLPTPPADGAPLIDWARFHIKYGEATGACSVTPLLPGEKKPYLPAWQKNPFNTEAQAEAHWNSNKLDNVGLVTRDEHFWFDADDLALLKAAEDKHGKLPSTYTQRSINGNLHYLFRGSVSGNSPAFFDGRKVADIRGAGAGQCVGAGSRGHNKRAEPGCWKIVNLALPAVAPDWVLAAIKGGSKGKGASKDMGGCETKRRDRSKPGAPPIARGVMIDHPRNEAFFADWLAGKSNRTLTTPDGEVAEPCIEGEFRDDRLAFTGAMGVDFGMSEDLAVALGLEHHNPRCEPPWDNDQYEYHYRSGYRSALAGAQLGWRAPYIDTSVFFKPVRKPANDATVPPDAASLGIFSDDELDTIPDPVWLIDGVIPEGSVTLYGKRGCMKSFAALDMALCIANGVPYHGKNVTQGRAVYFAGEGFKGNKRRIKAWYKEHKLTPSGNLKLIRTAIKWDMDKGREKARQILAEVAKGGPITVAIIDTVRKGMSGDENAPTQVGHFLDGVSETCEPFGCGYWLVHHAGKDDSKGARGGGPFEDDVDAVFKFKRPTKSGPVSMECTKQKDGEDGQRYVFRPEVFKLGEEANGKPITSLVLKLESESQGDDEEDGGSGASKRDRWADHDDKAAHILDEMKEALISRADLATAVMLQMSPEMRETDTVAFERQLRLYRQHLGRRTSSSSLWPYVAKEHRNDAGQAMSFPTRRTVASGQANRKRRGGNER